VFLESTAQGRVTKGFNASDVSILRLAGRNQHAHMAGIKWSIQPWEVILGEFLDALKAGQQAKQNRIEAEQRKAVADERKVHDELDAASKWVSNVLGPVAVELHNDLAFVGRVGIEDVSRAHIVARDVTIALKGHKPTRLSFHIQNGAITVFRDGAEGNTIDVTTTISQVQIKNLFRETLNSVGKA
jgi:hypothetical protein